MGEGYESVPDAESWQELDEFLCEYVDGSMDPVVREVFEEYVRETPELAEHVKCLCEARDVLIHSACACRLKADFADRLRRRLTAEHGESRDVVLPDMVSHLGYLAAFTSALVVMTVAAVLLGEMLVNDEAALLCRRQPIGPGERAGDSVFEFVCAAQRPFASRERIPSFQSCCAAQITDRSALGGRRLEADPRIGTQRSIGLVRRQKRLFHRALSSAV